jgi:hypothetical protein
MKNCQRLDNVKTNMIPFEESTTKLLKKNKAAVKLKKSNKGSQLAKKLGGDWSALGSSCEISSTSNEITSYIRVSQNSKNNNYEFSLSFDTTKLKNKSCSNFDELRQSISDTLVDAVRSLAESGNKLG